MSKQKNLNIGMCRCPMHGCKEIAAVRKNKNGKLYCDCPECGRITPNLAGGQDKMLTRATIWGETGTPPQGVPQWIRDNLSSMKAAYNPAVRQPQQQGEAPLTGAAEEKHVNDKKLPPPPPQTKAVKQEPTQVEKKPESTGFSWLEGLV